MPRARPPAAQPQFARIDRARTTGATYPRLLELSIQRRYVRTVHTYRFLLCLTPRYAYLWVRSVLRERTATPVLAARDASARVVSTAASAARARVRASLPVTLYVLLLSYFTSKVPCAQE